MIQLSFTADASDFASDDQLSAFFDALKNAFRAARTQAASAVRSVVSAPAAPVPLPAPTPAPVAAPAATSAPVAAAAPAPAEEPPKARKPRQKRAEAAPATEAAPAEATAAKPAPTLDDIRAAATACLNATDGGAELIQQTFQVLKVTKFHEIPEHLRATCIDYWKSNGDGDLSAMVSLANDEIPY